MKFFHLSDLHIGLKLMNRDLREDQEYILSKIVEAAGREETFMIKPFRLPKQSKFLTGFSKN